MEENKPKTPIGKANRNWAEKVRIALFLLALFSVGFFVCGITFFILIGG